MRKIKSIVVQQEKSGCAAACIATILEVDYWSVAKCFKTDLSKYGLTTKEISDFLAGYGFDVIEKHANYYGSGYINLANRMLQPFADIHIATLEHYIGKDNRNDAKYHGVLMDNKGNLFCPSDGKEYKGNYLTCFDVLGFYYPKGWIFKTRNEKLAKIRRKQF